MTNELSMPTAGIAPATGLHYLAAGSGPPVVFLHGLGAFKEIWWGTLQAVAPEFYGIAFDFPGHGQSPAPTAFVLDTLADVIATTCVALKFQAITLVGHSMGGNVAARLALRHPALVQRLVLVDAALEMQYLSPRSRVFLHPRHGENRLHLTRRLIGPLARWGSRVPHNHSGGIFRPLARRTHYVIGIEAQVMQRYIAALWESSLGERLRDIRQPTLLITGALDRMVSPRQVQAAALLIPNAQIRIITGALHNPMDERPAVFQASLLEFLHQTVPTAAKDQAHD